MPARIESCLLWCCVSILLTHEGAVGGGVNQVGASATAPSWHAAYYMVEYTKPTVRKESAPLLLMNSAKRLSNARRGFIILSRVAKCR